MKGCFIRYFGGTSQTSWGNINQPVCTTTGYHIDILIFPWMNHRAVLHDFGEACVPLRQTLSTIQSATNAQDTPPQFLALRRCAIVCSISLCLLRWTDEIHSLDVWRGDTAAISPQRHPRRLCHSGLCGHSNLSDYPSCGFTSLQFCIIIFLASWYPKSQILIARFLGLIPFLQLVAGSSSRWAMAELSITSLIPSTRNIAQRLESTIEPETYGITLTPRKFMFESWASIYSPHSTGLELSWLL